MKTLRFVAAATAVFTLGCADGPTGPDHPAPALALGASPARQVQATGAFDAIVDFSTLTLTPRGRNCLLTVMGQLVFTGTIVGPAVGQTTALVFASCEDVATNPPGTFPDVFHSELEFDGTVNGDHAQANVRYVGRSEPGGHIDANLLFSRGVEGRLAADAQLAVGGTYDGAVVVR